jgi:hypothetical protein
MIHCDTSAIEKAVAKMELTNYVALISRKHEYLAACE